MTGVTLQSWKGALLLSVCACVVGLLVFQTELNTNGDNGAYISYAQSLAQGEGLGLAGHPDHIRSDKFPLLYPLFLAFWIKVFGYHLMLLKAVMLGVFVAAMFLFYRIAQKTLTGPLLTGLGALVITNYWLLDNATITMSEPLFMLLLLAAFLLMLRHETSFSNTALAGSAVCLILAAFVRTIGVAPLFAFSLYLAYRRRWRFLAGCTAGFLVLYFINRSFMAPGGYGGVLFMADPYHPEMGSIGMGEFLKRLLDNSLFYAENTVQMTLFSFMGDQARFDRTSVILFTVLLVIIFFSLPLREILKRPGALFLRLMVLAYLGILLTWPMVWSGPRFVVPIIPFLLLTLFENGHYWIKRWVKPELLPRLEKAALLVCLVWAALNFSAIYQKTHTPLTQDWADYYALAEWARQGLPENAVVCNRSTHLFYLKSGKQSVGFPFTTDRHKVLQFLIDNRVAYVVLDHFAWSGSTQMYLAPLVAEFPERFKQLKAMGTAQMYEFR